MSDTTISICTGILYDSGGEDGLYDNNENLTTVINPGGIITLTFSGTFTIENNLDLLTIYDGPDTSSPLLGTFTGSTLPPVLVANSGAVTLVFTSDNSAIYAGFTMTWESDFPEPVPPNISVATLPACGSNQLQVNFSYLLFCEWLDTAQWTVTTNGNENEVLSTTVPCVSDSTGSIILNLEDPFTANCDYEIELIIEIPDDCGLIYQFTVTTNFVYDQCGIDASISSSESVVCPGACAGIAADVVGCFTYTYAWNNGLPATAGPHTVCPTVNTTYSVTITEVETGNVTTLNYTLPVFTSSIITPDTTICQSVDDLFLEAEIEGLWSGPGILDEETGQFDPDTAFAGVNIIEFEAQGCVDTLLITVIPIQTDDIIAACPGSDPITLNAVPAGGTWSGPNTTIDGTFDPIAEGTYTVIYELGTCTDLLTINVDSIDGVFVLDSICQSVDSDTLEFSPLGGYWEGPGIVDSLAGIFVPSEAPGGDVLLTYTIYGCAQNATVFVKEIEIGGNYHTTCPEEPPLVWYEGGAPIPPGGYWTGDGIIDPATGYFDPSLIPNDFNTSIIYYAPNGCTDTTYIYNRLTEIALDTAWFCLGYDVFELSEDNVNHVPSNGGMWTGTAITNPDYDYFLFDPNTAGVGIFELTYEKNNCTDSLIAVVFPDGVEPTTMDFCETEEPVDLSTTDYEGAFWFGQGITNVSNGIYDPGNAPIGESYVYWINQAGCNDSIQMNVEEFFQASISGLDDIYCFQNIDIPVTLFPDDGVLTGPINNGNFNPSVAGEGSHEIIYTYTGILCSSADTVQVSVYPELIVDLAASDSLICEGSASVLTATVTGGHPTLLPTYLWSDGAFPVSTNSVVLTESTMMYVSVQESCSDAAIDSVFIEVLPPISVQVATSDTLCFGEPGFAAATAQGSASFAFSWDGVAGETIDAPAGTSLVLLVEDLINGCEKDTLVLIPNYPPLTAQFSINPNLGCIPYSELGNVQIIDLSLNAVAGTWDLGNGNIQPYVLGETPDLDLATAGSFPIILAVENIGDCVDTATQVICILPSTPIFIPDIFSPNGDSFNDVLFVRSQGIVSMEFVVFNRWGEKVFQSNDVQRGWDGQHRGQPSPSGSYVYYLNAQMNDGTVQEMKGEIQLVR